MSYVSYMSFFMNRLKSIEITWTSFKYNIFCFQKVFEKFSRIYNDGKAKL